MSKNQLGDGCIQSFGDLMQNNYHVEYVNIGYNKITDKGIEILSSYLIGNTTLKSIDISFNEGITDLSLPFLKEIAMKSYLENINITNTSISELGQEEINKLLLFDQFYDLLANYYRMFESLFHYFQNQSLFIN